MTTTNELHQTFADPPREFGILPFWFWNDDLQDDELRRQIHEFHAKGFGGFLLHPRVGLSRRIGYLTDEFFRLVRLAVDEAAALGMKVVLYDEGSYPSGSAAGQVVAANPAHASRAIITRQQAISGPATGYWHPNPGRALTDELLAVVAGRETEPGAIDPATLTILPVQEPELVRYDLPAGQWRLIAIWHVHSGGAIRGVFAEQEDGHALAPAAGDILNPDAVASFIQLTHDRYYDHLADHFGNTVVAMFTDEPMVLGRGAKRGPQAWPFTPGFLAEVQQGWDEAVTGWLPALWLDYGDRTTAFRRHYTAAVNRRLERVFYGAQGQWCADHGIALTGHPAESNDFGALRKFQWPGQDMVWRWVTPGSANALEGAHSCAPKSASSAATLQGSPRNGSEALGAYGWQLTLDETKWLLDWQCTSGAGADLRVLHYRKVGREFYLLVNEGEEALVGTLSLAATGALDAWDPLTGTVQPWPGLRQAQRTVTEIHLARRQSTVLVVDPNGAPTAAAPQPPQPGAAIGALIGPWQATVGADNPVDLPCPGDWAQVAGWETFAGTVTFATTLTLADGQSSGPLFLDLGKVGDIAEVLVNGETVGVCAWAPYHFRIDGHCRAGANSLTVTVTNSIANRYEGMQRPSGILGPVTVRVGG